MLFLTGLKIDSVQVKYFASTLICLIVYSSCSENTRTVSFDSAEFASVVKTLESGKWIWEDSSCERGYQIFRFNIEQRTMVLHSTQTDDSGESGNKRYTYDLLTAYTRGFRGRLRDEKRVNDAGETVEWDLFIESNDSFYWKRSDWSLFSGTKLNVRCD